jgi:hypothetical protein
MSLDEIKRVFDGAKLLTMDKYRFWEVTLKTKDKTFIERVPANNIFEAIASSHFVITFTKDPKPKSRDFIEITAISCDPYVDETFDARECDHCHKTYKGPAVVCSLECAIASA